MVELFAGRYAFVDLLGAGGMGTVWRVWDAKRREYTAAKVLSRADSTSLLRFIRETSWRVDHAHVLTPTGWAAEDDRVLFTMPLLRGGTVGDLVRDFGALPDALAAELLRQLLAGLAAVHAAGLVHRDVKPANLLLDPPGAPTPHLFLSDFGIAARVDEPRLTRVGEAVGTLGYTAPEVLTGADPHPAQDLYAAGVVALELLTGRRPAADGSSTARDLHGHPLEPIVSRLLQRRADDRPTAQEALDTLAATPGAAARTDEEPAEVFDHVPELPDGWGPDGPAGEPVPVVPAMAADPLTRTRTSPTDPVRPAEPTVAFAAAAAPRAAPLRTASTGPPAVRDPDRRRRWVAPTVVAVVLLLIGAAAIAGGLALLR